MQDYHLLQQIGEGSFGRVYKARRKFTGRLVAIKMINKLGQSKDDLLSFRREIDILKKVKHPNIMCMLDMFESDTDFNVVSELARGDLFQIIDDNQTLPEEVLKTVAAQLTSALAYLHKNKIIHRDMKPQNILITNKGALKLCDFGFARALSSTTLFLNSIKGTPLYMAPELVQEQRYDEKIDVWSLGIILYELFYGQPPFFTNSIYKLIQMIVNDPIQWPGPISENFKSFLLKMLQKDPADRISCEELLQHPFIADVKLKDFDDHVYQFKSKQFEEAISESLSPEAPIPFNPPKSKLPDFQSIFVNPSVRSPEELLLAVKYLRELHAGGDSPLAASFSFHFKEFISKPIVLEEALMCATELLAVDKDKFINPFSVGLQVFGMNEMPICAVNFFTNLLSVPYAAAAINYSDPPITDLQLNQERAEKLRDRLLSFLFAPDVEAVERTYVFLAYLTQSSDILLNSLCGDFAPQFVPIATSAVIHHPSPAVKAAAFCILTKIVDKNNSLIKYIQPISGFVESLFQIVSGDLDSVCNFCVFSSAISFIAVSVNLLAQISEFQQKFSVRQSLSNMQQFVDGIFCGKEGIESRLSILMEVGAKMPETDQEILSYVSILSSPFAHVPMKEKILQQCIIGIASLLPIHQPALLSTIFTLPFNLVCPTLPSLLGLFSSPSNATVISEYITAVIAEPENVKSLITVLTENKYLTVVAGLISEMGPQIPPQVMYAWTQVLLSFREPTEILLHTAPQLLQTLFALDSAAETSLMVAAHLARLSDAFIPALLDANVLVLTERALQSEAVQIRIAALGFIGNFTRREPLPGEAVDALCPYIVSHLRDENQQAQRQAAFAMGNLLTKNSSAVDFILKDISAPIELLQSTDSRTVENAAGVLGNIVRRKQSVLDQMIQAGALDLMVKALGYGEETGGKVLLQIAVFCQYKQARTYLVKNGAQKSIQMYTKAKDPRVKKYAQSILDSFEV